MITLCEASFQILILKVVGNKGIVKLSTNMMDDCMSSGCFSHVYTSPINYFMVFIYVFLKTQICK